jgi:hypothetical protein
MLFCILHLVPFVSCPCSMPDQSIVFQFDVTCSHGECGRAGAAILHPGAGFGGRQAPCGHSHYTCGHVHARGTCAEDPGLHGALEPAAAPVCFLFDTSPNNIEPENVLERVYLYMYTHRYQVWPACNCVICNVLRPTGRLMPERYLPLPGGTCYCRFNQLSHRYFIEVSPSKLNFFKYHMLVHVPRPFFQLGDYDSTATGEGLHHHIKQWYREKTNHRSGIAEPYQLQVYSRPCKTYLGGTIDIEFHGTQRSKFLVCSAVNSVE